MRVLEWGFRSNRLEGYVARDLDPSVLAVPEDLSPEARRARELEARGYEERPLAFKWDDKLLFAAGGLAEVDPDAVRSLRPSIEGRSPSGSRASRGSGRGAGAWNRRPTNQGCLYRLRSRSF